MKPCAAAGAIAATKVAATIRIVPATISAARTNRRGEAEAIEDLAVGIFRGKLPAIVKLNADLNAYPLDRATDSNRTRGDVRAPPIQS
jgi:hypothetical protein